MYELVPGISLGIKRVSNRHRTDSGTLSGGSEPKGTVIYLMLALYSGLSAKGIRSRFAQCCHL